MANPHKFYLRHMNSKTGYRATWDPGRELRIGQVGRLDKTGVFNVFSSLEEEGIPAAVSIDTTGSQMDHTSHDNVTISIKAAGSAPAVGSVLTQAEAGFGIEFKNERAVVFQIDSFKTHEITNLGAIERAVLDKFDAGNWEKDWLIITQLVVADNATIIISNSSQAKLELKASANATAGQLTLTDASLGLAVAREQGSTIKFIAKHGLTPLYRVMGIRHPLFGKKKLDTRSLAPEATAETSEATDAVFAQEGKLQVQQFVLEELETPEAD